MSVMLSQTYDALRSASGVSDQQAREAAEEIAAFGSRLLRVEIKLKLNLNLNLLITLGASTLVGVGLVLLRLFVFD